MKELVLIFILLTTVLLSTFVFMTGVWATDIGVSALLTNTFALGLFGIRDGNMQYHLGLMLSSIAFLFSTLTLSFLVIYHRKVRTK